VFNAFDEVLEWEACKKSACEGGN